MTRLSSQSEICILKSEIKSILIIKPSSLGDVVHTLPAVAAIREANPEAKITWVINPEWTTLLRGNPDIDHVHIFPRGEFRSLSAPASLLPWWLKERECCARTLLSISRDCSGAP